MSDERSAMRSVTTPVPGLAAAPHVQQLAVLPSVDGHVETHEVSFLTEPKTPHLGDGNAGLDLAGLGQRDLFPPADVLEEMLEPQRGFFRRAECQQARRAVIPDLMHSARGTWK